MRLDEVYIDNFRQYKDATFDFTKYDGKYDMNLIVGKNGVGKTTFLNAINWCLYGNELHSVQIKDSDKLPLFRLQGNKDDEIVKVILKVSAENGTNILYRREYYPKSGNENFTVLETFADGQSKIWHGEEANMRVDQFVPSVIKDFFFFDGEHLDNYFLESNTKNIRGMVSTISQIDLLDYIADKLNKKIKSFKRSAGSKDSDIEKLSEQIDFNERNKEKLKKEIKDKEADIKKAQDKINKLNNELANFKDIRAYEQERTTLKKELDRISEEINECEQDIESCILKYAPSIFLSKPINYVLNVEMKEKSSELPPKIDKSVVEESLDKKICKVCGRHLTEEIEEDLRETLNQYDLSSNQSKILRKLDSCLQVPKNAVNDYKAKKASYSKTYKTLSKNYVEKKNRLDEIEKYIKMSSNESSSAKFEERENLENQIKENLKFIGSRTEQLNSVTAEINLLNTDLLELMSKNEVAAKFAKRKILCEDALATVYSSKELIMEKTKERVEQVTNKTFFDLLWKKGTYDYVDVDDDYNLKLIHNETKQDSLGSASAAERELLALSFTLGVHNISGFNSSLLIDTPLARVSDDHRVNFANVLLEVSKNKQIILLFTPAEFSDDIKEILDIPEVTKYSITMNESEDFTTVGEYKND